MKPTLPFATLSLVIAALAIHCVPGSSERLQFDRAAIQHGEAWRWLSGHLTHFEGNHLTWDVGVLLLLGSAAERQNRQRFIRTILVSATAISAAVWWWQPQFQQYRGLSGIDSALFGLLAGALLRRRQLVSSIVASLALLAIGFKSALELATGSTVFATAASYAPVPLAHLVGLAIGLAMAFTGDKRSIPLATSTKPARQITAAFP